MVVSARFCTRSFHRTVGIDCQLHSFVLEYKGAICLSLVGEVRGMVYNTLTHDVMSRFEQGSQKGLGRRRFRHYQFWNLDG